MFSAFERILMPVADKLGKNKILVAIRDGFLVTTPLILSLIHIFNIKS